MIGLLLAALLGDFQLTPAHEKLLRQATVVWLPIESGAPGVLISPTMLESEDGEPDLADVARRAGVGDDRAAAARLVREMPDALAMFLSRAHLAPGTYAHGGEGGTFTVTSEHLKLLRALRWEGLMVNAKRPYGDMTYFELDMADVLGEPSVQEADGQLPAAQAERLGRLHEETRLALQDFLQHARLDP